MSKPLGNVFEKIKLFLKKKYILYILLKPRFAVYFVSLDRVDKNQTEHSVQSDLDRHRLHESFESSVSKSK